MYMYMYVYMISVNDRIPKYVTRIHTYIHCMHIYFVCTSICSLEQIIISERENNVYYAS